MPLMDSKYGIFKNIPLTALQGETCGIKNESKETSKKFVGTRERMRILSQEEAVVLESRQIEDVVGTCQGMDIRKERRGQRFISF